MGKKSKLSLFKIDHSLGPLERKVMAVIWSKDRITVREVLNILKDQKFIAYTTVMTVMDNLYKKGFLARYKIKKTYHYYPVAKEKDLISQSLSGVFASLISEYGTLKVSSSIILSNLTDLVKLDSIHNFSKTTIANGSSIRHGLSLTILITLFTFSTWDLVQNLQFFGTLDYFKYAFLEPEILLNHSFLLITAFVESLPLVNLFTTLTSLVLVIVFSKKLVQLFQSRTSIQKGLRGAL